MTLRPRSSPPLHLSALSQLLRNQASLRGSNEFRLRNTVATTVIGQLLPSGAVKGGAAMKLRSDGQPTRFSIDLDVTRGATVDLVVYIGELTVNLEQGWHGFTGRVVARRPATPPGVPAGYVMTPFDVKLAYRSRAWLTVPLEIGHEEIDGLAHARRHISPDIVVFISLGFPQPAPIPLLPIEHQIAQKLHACSAPHSDRAHDLVDLQLLLADPSVNLAALGRTVRRLFAARKLHDWPPSISIGPDWGARYREASDGINVAADVSTAIGWANSLITSIVIATDASVSESGSNESSNGPPLGTP